MTPAYINGLISNIIETVKEVDTNTGKWEVTHDRWTAAICLVPVREDLYFEDLEVYATPGWNGAYLPMHWISNDAVPNDCTDIETVRFTGDIKRDTRRWARLVSAYINRALS